MIKKTEKGFKTFLYEDLYGKVVTTDMIVSTEQIPYNLAFVDRLDNGHVILTPMSGNTCLYFEDAAVLDSMIANRSYPDIEIKGSRVSLFRKYRNYLKNINEDAEKLINILCQKVELSRNEMDNDKNSNKLSKRIDSLRTESYGEACILLGVYLGSMIKEQQNMSWEVNISYEGFNPNWIPELINNEGTRILLWREIYKELDNKVFNILRLKKKMGII